MSDSKTMLDSLTMTFRPFNNWWRHFALDWLLIFLAGALTIAGVALVVSVIDYVAGVLVS